MYRLIFLISICGGNFILYPPTLPLFSCFWPLWRFCLFFTKQGINVVYLYSEQKLRCVHRTNARKTPQFRRKSPRKRDSCEAGCVLTKQNHPKMFNIESGVLLNKENLCSSFYILKIIQIWGCRWLLFLGTAAFTQIKMSDVAGFSWLFLFLINTLVRDTKITCLNFSAAFFASFSRFLAFTKISDYLSSEQNAIMSPCWALIIVYFSEGCMAWRLLAWWANVARY